MSEFFKKKNSIGILYLNRQKADLDEVVEVSRKINLPIKEIFGVQPVGPSKIVVKVMDHSSDLFDKIMKTYENQVLTLEERNVNVQIINLSLNKVVVTIKNVPFEFPEYMLRSILSEYGHVYNIRSQTYTHGPLNGILNGNRTALMTLRKSIPSSIIFEGAMFLMSYRGQLRTCLKCGFSGHLAAQCTANQWELINRLNEADFPELRKRTEKSVENNGADQENVNATGNESCVEIIVPSENTSDVSKSFQESGNPDIPKESRNLDEVELSDQCEASFEKEETQNIDSSPDGFHNSVSVVQVHTAENEDIRDVDHNNAVGENCSMVNEKASAVTDSLENSGIVGAMADVDLRGNVINDNEDNLLEYLNDESEPMEDDIATKILEDVRDTSKEVSQSEQNDSVDANCNDEENGSSKGKWHTVMKKNKKENTVKKVYPVRKKTQGSGDGDKPRSLVKRKHAAVEMFVNDTVKMTKVKGKTSSDTKNVD